MLNVLLEFAVLVFRVREGFFEIRDLFAHEMILISRQLDLPLEIINLSQLNTSPPEIPPGTYQLALRLFKVLIGCKQELHALTVFCLLLAKIGVKRAELIDLTLELVAKRIRLVPLLLELHVLFLELDLALRRFQLRRH